MEDEEFEESGKHVKSKSRIGCFWVILVCGFFIFHSYLSPFLFPKKESYIEFEIGNRKYIISTTANDNRFIEVCEKENCEIIELKNGEKYFKNSSESFLDRGNDGSLDMYIKRQGDGFIYIPRGTTNPEHMKIFRDAEEKYGKIMKYVVEE